MAKDGKGKRIYTQGKKSPSVNNKNIINNVKELAETT